MPAAGYAVELENIFKLYNSFKEGKEFTEALLDVSLKIKEGSLTIVAGSNGSGKSVLMNIISGLEKPTKGTVKTRSVPGLVFQDANVQILGDTVIEDVSIGPRNQKKSRSEIQKIAENAIKAVSLEEKSTFATEFLSGGQKRRLAAASIIAMDKEIIIFDEPYANLDYPGIKDVNSLIKNLHNSGKTIILLTHELEKSMALCSHFIVLVDGKKVFDGPPEDALKENLEKWGIRNPLVHYDALSDLVWE